MLHSNRLKQRKLTFSSLEKLSFSRKGQGLQINTIILIVLGLLVLAILIVYVQTQVVKGGKGLKAVTENTCTAPDYQKASTGAECEIVYAVFKDLKPGEICCKFGTIKP